MAKQPYINPSNVAASICREELYFFMQEFWPVMIKEDPVWNWHIKYVCDELQELMERVIRREKKAYDLIINIPPGTTKSTMASVAMPAWAWARDPSLRSIHGSHTIDLALDLSSKSRTLIQSDKYREYFPEVQMRADLNALGRYENTLGGMRVSVGAKGSIIGRHAHYLDVDDPIDPEAARSDQDTVTVNRWITQTLMQRVVDRSLAPLILIMQRLSQDDPTGHMLEVLKDNKVRHICLPAEVSDNIMPTDARRFYKDNLLDPNRLSRDVLKTARVILEEYGYAGQMMQTPIPDGGAMFKIDKIQRGRVPPDSEMRDILRFWDKAGTHKGGDFSVGALMARGGDNKIWIKHLERGQWATDDREDRIVKCAKRDGRHVLVGSEQEPGSGGKESAEGTRNRLMGIARFRAEPAKGDKVLRADEFSYQVNSGNVWIPDTNEPWIEPMLQEMKYFPYSKYMDQVDALAGGYAMLAKSRRRVGAFR